MWLIANGVAGLVMALWPAYTAVLSPTHAHLGTVGFFLSMVMGVAYWMLPRPGGIKQTKLELTTLVFLQSGMVTRVVGEPWWRATGDPLPYALFAMSGGLVFAAVLTFAFAMRKRIVTVEVIRAMARPRKGSANQGSADQGAADQGSADHGAADHGSADHGTAPDEG